MSDNNFKPVLKNGPYYAKYAFFIQFTGGNLDFSSGCFLAIANRQLLT